MRRLFAFLLLSVILPAAAMAADPGMIRIQYRLVAFGIDPKGFDGALRSVWRVADTQLRYEEPPNPATGSQLLAVVSMPDAWFIDLTARRGTYRKDPGPSFKVRFPAFPPQFGEEIGKLEMGFEKEFFAERKAADGGERTVLDVPCRLQTTEVDGKKLTLYVRKSDGLPFQVVVETAERAVAVRYERYETGVAVDKALFRPPAGVEIKAEEPAAKK